MAEFVVDVRRGNRMVREKSQPQRARQDSQEQHAPAGFLRERPSEWLDPRARGQGQKNQQRGDNELDEVARAEADRIAEGQKRAHEIGQMHEVPFSQDVRYVAAGTITLMIVPGSAEELAEALASAQRNHQTIQLFGNTTKERMGGPIRAADVCISTAKLNRVLQYEPNDLTISVEAGITYRELNRVLAEHRQMVP